jgi:single-strand DNA-binding protein
MSVNIVIMNGRLAATPEAIKINERTKVKFRMANKRKYRAKDGDLKEITTWVDVECWGPLAENVAKYCIQGQEVTVNGRLAIEPWEDKEGNKRTSTKINANDVIFGNKPREALESAATGMSPTLFKENAVKVGALVKNGVEPAVAVDAVLNSLSK